MHYYSAKNPPAHISVTTTGKSINLHAILYFSQHHLQWPTMLSESNVTPEILPSRASAAFVKGFFVTTPLYDKLISAYNKTVLIGIW